MFVLFNFGPIVYRLEHSVFIRKGGIRFPVGLPIFVTLKIGSMSASM